MNTLSPWAIAAKLALTIAHDTPVFNITFGFLNFNLKLVDGALWGCCHNHQGEVAFRIAYAPDDRLRIKRKTVKGSLVTLLLESAFGDYKVDLELTESIGYPLLRYTTTLTPKRELVIPFWPKDIIFPGPLSSQPKGEVYVNQVGTRSGQLHFGLESPAIGSIFYLQNLTSLSTYNQDTQTSASNLMGGVWPEIGFSLPPTLSKPLQKGKKYIISDAIIAFDPSKATDQAQLTRQYLNMLSAVYLLLPRPETVYRQWPKILQEGLDDLIDSPGCWSQVNGHRYLNAYVSDHETPPEIMVQLAVLLPLIDYVEWSGADLPIMQHIKAGLSAFWDENLKTVVRWLPAAADKLKGDEEQKTPMVMDSWYLHHPLLNLSRLALKGDPVAEKLLVSSLPYAIKVAKHFNYNWPVFYKMDTLEVVKAETKAGAGGQHDVAGLYAHVMLQAYELTRKKSYLIEAEKAARSLKGKDFHLFYQANNTAFSAGALLRLYKLTQKQDYLDLSYLCLAGVFQNCQLWDCNYGYGVHFPSFFALFPLSDAPYTAAYEEQEVFCALHDYLQHAEAIDLLPAVRLLCSEYIRNLVNRAPYYYPPLLPNDMLSDEVKTGEVDRKRYIALEDLHDGWEKSGAVGQEVYGAGNAFGVLPRHYHQVKNEHFMIYADYPINNLQAKSRSANFHLGGASQILCRLRILISPEDKRNFVLTMNQQAIEGTKTKEGHLEFKLNGDQKLKLSW